MYMPLEDLPKHHSARKHVNLVIILRMWMPELWSLPIDRTNEATHHRSRRLLDFGQSKVGNLGDAS